jgi:hypothetical protein
MLAASIGQSVIAGPPVGDSGAVTFAVDDEEGDAFGAPSAVPVGFSPYQQAQYVSGGEYQGVPGDAYGGPGVPLPNPWPETSPYSQHRVQSVYNNAGLWESSSDDNFDRKGFFTLGYLLGHGLKPQNHLIGDPTLAGARFVPGPTPIGVPPLWPAQFTGDFWNFYHDGITASLGFENPDLSGAMLTGFFLFDSQLSNANTQVHAIAGDPTTLTPLASIIVNNGNGQSTVLPFDAGFTQTFNQEIWGGDADIYLAPFFERQSFKMKWLFGAKYLRISEQMQIEGDGSGLGYAFVPNNTIATGGTGGATGTVGLNPIIGPFVPLLPPYSTFITSSTTSNLIGPQLGLRADLGGDKFKIWGQTRFAVAYDHEAMRVASSNVAPFVAYDGVISVVQGPAPAGSGLNTVHTATNNHIAPIVDMQVNMDFNGFEWIPLINRMALFKNAKTRIGYQWVWVNNVVRPPIIINYLIADPTIHTGQRTYFAYNAVNFSVAWKW